MRKDQREKQRKEKELQKRRMNQRLKKQEIITYEEPFDENSVQDYSKTFSSFDELFSLTYLQPKPMGTMDIYQLMNELVMIFENHLEQVDSLEQMVMQHRQVKDSKIQYKNPTLKQYENTVDLEMNNDEQEQEQYQQNLQYYRVVKRREEVYDIISRGFVGRQSWGELPHGANLKTSYNFLWTWSKPQLDMSKLLYFQKVNHFPLNKNCGRKDLLKKNIDRLVKKHPRLGRYYEIVPRTFCLPKEYSEFSEHFHQTLEREGPEGNIWISKPIGKSRGRGIEVVTQMNQLVCLEPVVVQKYISQPLLLDGFKYDMRIYAVVTSFNPLEVFLFKEGFARLSSQKFTLDSNTFDNLFVHLTNVAIHKDAPHMDNHWQQSHPSLHQLGGTKVSLKYLKSTMEQHWDNVWTQIQQVVIKSLLACQQDIPNNPNCFELFGYDIMLDSSYKCWLIEINQSPALSTDTILDHLVKNTLISDIISLISPMNYDRKRLVEVMKRRLFSYKENQDNPSKKGKEKESKESMNRDISYILHNQSIREVGEMPAKMGNFIRIAPSDFSNKLLSIIDNNKTTHKQTAMAQFDN